MSLGLEPHLAAQVQAILTAPRISFACKLIALAAARPAILTGRLRFSPSRATYDAT